MRVHEAVLAAGDRETGVTIHVVDEEYDQGPIVAQCRVPVLPGDTLDTLAARVLAREHTFLVETLERIVSGTLRLEESVDPAPAEGRDSLPARSVGGLGGRPEPP